jgi:UDP-glucose 4-epimerase
MSDYSQRRVLVTGGAGFVGSHLIEELVARGAAVTVVDNLCTGHMDNLAPVDEKLDFRTFDLRHDDLRALLAERQFDVLFHLAANAYVPPSFENPRWDFETNAVATFELLEAVREASPETKIVYTSTAAVYGEGSSVPFRETDPTVPVSPYGISKLAAERYISIYARLYGLRTTVARLFPIHGPRLRKQVVYDLLCRLREDPNELFIYGDGSQIRDLTHVANYVEGILLLAERAPWRGEAYNVSAENPVSIADLAGALCELLGVTPRFAYSGDVRPGDANLMCADTTRLKALGYRSRMGFREGLADTVAWFEEESARPEAAPEVSAT